MKMGVAYHSEAFKERLGFRISQLKTVFTTFKKFIAKILEYKTRFDFTCFVMFPLLMSAYSCDFSVASFAYYCSVTHVGPGFRC